MHIAEIIILIAGAVLFTVSFIMPDKGGSAELDEEEERKLIKELLDKEIDTAKYQIEEATEECVNENRDRMERALDRITNEKMNAVNDYSNTVLDQIHKNHDEVMFLYDMLNNKHTQVKNTAAELNQITKSARAVAGNIENANATATQTVVNEAVIEDLEQAKAAATNVKTMPKTDSGNNSSKSNVPMLTKPDEVHKNSVEKGYGYVNPGKNTIDGQGFGFTKPASKTEVSESIFEEIPKKELDVVEIDVTEQKPAPKKKTAKAKVEKIPVVDSGIDLMFASDNNSANNNDKILALHKEGKSNMAIAKELGLGIGEVKLVIDLFEGI